MLLPQHAAVELQHLDQERLSLGVLRLFHVELTKFVHGSQG